MRQHLTFPCFIASDTRRSRSRSRSKSNLMAEESHHCSSINCGSIIINSSMQGNIVTDTGGNVLIGIGGDVLMDIGRDVLKDERQKEPKLPTLPWNLKKKSLKLLFLVVPVVLFRPSRKLRTMFLSGVSVGKTTLATKFCQDEPVQGISY
ncbi:hypothetical protein M0R45_020140 [Rubus argutus]|uniref:Uncharacterized protein n=1 Tax=Rubus argutus TaxID=59490 RepID=A0AAW1X9U2_RUBAR